MSQLEAYGGGVVLALSFALLWQRRFGGMLAVLALQTLVTAALAARQHAWPVAAVELGWGAIGLPWLLSRTPAAPPWSGAGSVPTMLAATMLSALCLPLGPIGPGLAVVLLGVLLMAVRPRPEIVAVALGSLQTGIVVAGLAAGQGIALLAAPCLPALTVLLQRLRARAQAERNRQRTPSRFAAELAFADFIACVLLLAVACALPWLDGAIAGPWRFGPSSVLAAILIALVAAALRLVRRQRAAPVGTLLTLGGFLAVLADQPLLAWVGLAVATGAALPPARASGRRLAAIGLGLTLFGSVTLHAAALPACVTMLVGLACLASIGPELATLAVLFLLPLRAALGAAPHLDMLLIAAGLLAMLAAAASLTAKRSARFVPSRAMLGQAGVAVFALGLDLPHTRLAAVLLLVLLVLTRLALELAAEDSLPRMAALAGLAGVPPFGLFPGLALLLAATTADAPGLLPPLLAGLAALGWLVLRAEPLGALRLRADPAWLPLAAALLIGFALPGPLAEGLRLIAERLP